MKGFRVLGEHLFSRGLTSRLRVGTRMTVGSDTSASLPNEWTRYEAVLSATVAGDQGCVLEPSVMNDNGTWKMWYTQGRTTQNVCYATSSDGITWTKYASNPVLANHGNAHVFKLDDTYYMYTAAGWARIDLYTSSDGISWTLDTASVIPKGAVGQWDASYVANSFEWIEDETWYMLYDGASPTGDWSIGLATSSDGRAWTKSASNPVLSPGGGPWVKKVGDTYWLWEHKPAGTGSLPTDIYRHKSTDLINWTNDPVPAVYPRASADEGYNTLNGQVADVCIVESGDYAYLFHDYTEHGGETDVHGLGIKMAKAPLAVISGTIPSNSPAVTPVTGAWYDPYEDIGAAHYGVYIPKGADDLADSLLRKFGNLGNADLDPTVVGVGVSPTWDAVNGWKFNGTDQFLDTGIVPTKNHSMVMIFSNRSGDAQAFGEFTANARFHLSIDNNSIVFATGGFATYAAAGLTSATVGMTLGTGYKNGVAVKAITPNWLATTTKNIWLGGRNDGGATPTAYASIYLQAVVIYDIEISGLHQEVIYNTWLAT